MKKIAFLALLAFLIVQSTSPVHPYEVGDTVENFKLQNVDGNWVSLDDYMGAEGIILIFTCNSCPYAQLYEDRIIDLHNNYQNQGFPVLAINPNDPEQKPADSFENMQKRADEKQFPFAYVFDDSQEVFPKFGATNTPQVFLVDKEMKLRYVGAIDDNPQNPDEVRKKYVEEAITNIKSGIDPNPQRTKAIGCGIKKKRS